MTVKHKPKIGPLATMGGVVTELARLYRQARWGQIEVADASRLATILGIMRQCLESSEIEARMAELEARLGSNVVPFRRTAA
jgi:hypothetical protein